MRPGSGRSRAPVGGRPGPDVPGSGHDPVSAKRTAAPHSALVLLKSRSVFSGEPLVKCRHLTTRVEHVCADYALSLVPHPRAWTRGRNSSDQKILDVQNGGDHRRIRRGGRHVLGGRCGAGGLASRPEAVDRHDPSPDKTTRSHDLKGPLSDTQAAQREEALKQVISGNASVKKKDGSNVVQLKSKKGDAKYVELGREKTDKIFTILVEFGDKVDSRYGGDAGPLHNEIAKPNRRTDNSTAWQEDYDQEHFQDLYFGSGKGVNSVKTYYEKQSSGRYSVDGEVSDWVKVPYNEARYGSNKCDPDNCAWYAVQDGVTAWIADQKAAGRTDAQIKSQLTQYDQWDRYDFDGDGDFNEPDGYIDHFQIVHAGEDESAGGGAQGEDAIWAHRWYAFGTDAAHRSRRQQARRHPDRRHRHLGRRLHHPAGERRTRRLRARVRPRPRPAGPLRHRRRRQLHRLLDADVVRLVAGHRPQRDRRPARRHERLGQAPTGLAELRHRQGGRNSWHKLGLAEYNTKHKQGLVVELPKEKVTTEIVTPAEGETQWWSGSGNDLKNTLSRSVDLTGKSAASLTLDGWYDIEADYDFLYTEVSTDGGANWTAIDGTFDGNPIQRDGSDKPALSATVDAYGKLVYPLDAYAGKKIDLRFRYQTDGGLAMKGFTADEIAVTADGETLFSDNAETADDAWTAVGFTRKRLLHQGVRAVLHRREPAVRVVRQDAEDRPVQLRLLGAPELGRALRVPERPADLEVGHLPGGQQHQPAPGQGPGPADRLAPDRAEVEGRHGHAQPHAGVRLAVQPLPHGRHDAAQGGRREVRPGLQGRLGLQRPQERLLRPGEPDRRCQDH